MGTGSRSRVQEDSNRTTPSAMTNSTPLGIERSATRNPAYGIVTTWRPMTAVAGVIDGSAVSFASPWVSIQTAPARSAMRMIRWVKTARSGPLRRLTTSPTARSRASTGATTTAAPSGMLGSIEAPATTKVAAPVRGTTRPRNRPNSPSATTMTARHRGRAGSR